jgi:XTP/dITP diphosphohydrolase
MKIIFATNNAGKVKELKIMAQSEGVELKTLSDLGLIFVPDETGTTFEENALIKATETAALLKKNGHADFIVLADDSGLCIDALNGEPGVDSALFMGENTPYDVRNAKIIEMLKSVPEEKRTARFVCAIACVLPSGEHLFTHGTIEGTIAHQQRGENGFGYDPIFYVKKFNKTTAELPQNEKNKISHRGEAFRKMLKILSDGVLVNAVNDGA